MIAPRVEHPEDEVDAFDAYLRRGGVGWVFAGSREFVSAPSLLSRFGVSIGDLPLGEATDAVLTGTATPVDMTESWPVEAPGAESLISVWDHTIALRKRVGSGALTVFGDPELFLGDGLYQAKKTNEINQAVIDRLIEKERSDS